MANRFLETNYYKSPFVRGLAGAIKGLYSFIICDCTPSGFWAKDMEAASMYIGFKVTEEDFKRDFIETGKAIELRNGKFFFPDFIEHQYPKGLQDNNSAHVNVILELKKFNLLKEEDKRVDEKGKISWHINFKKKAPIKPLGSPIGYGNGYSYSNGQGNGYGATEIVFPLSKLYNMEFEDLSPLFKELTREGFKKWKKFVDFIYEKNFTELFKCQFVRPQDFEKMNFAENKWEEVLKAILATGIKAEHNLFFRIPEFIKYKESKNGFNTTKGGASSKGSGIAGTDVIEHDREYKGLRRNRT